jgi:RimJ/RimL family protein N-acetyltransferase
LYSPTKIVTENKEMTLKWLEKAIPWLSDAKIFFGECEAFSLVREGGPNGLEFVGAVVFNNYRSWDKDIELNIYALPHIMNKGVCIALSRYVFGILACERCSLTLPKSAKPLRKVAEKIGFQREGARRLGWHGKENSMLYGMLKSECRWFDQDQWDQAIAKEKSNELGRRGTTPTRNSRTAAAA